MWNPFAGAWDRARAHPVQAGISSLAGMFIPGGNYLANLGFRAYNNNQFNNAAQANTQHMLQQSGQGVNWSTPDYFGVGPLSEGSAAPASANPFGGFGGFNMNNPTASWGQAGNPNGLLDFMGAGPQNYDNSPQGGGNLGIAPSAPSMGMGPGFGNTFGYSQAGGGSGAGVWNGGGGMHSFQVNSGSLSPSNYGGLGGGGIARGRGRENGNSQN